MSNSTYDIYIVDFYYEDSPGKSKQRPALVLGEGNIAYMFAKITSKNKQRSKYDYVIRDWELAGLKEPSVVRLDKRLILNNEHVHKRIGHLSKYDEENVHKLLYFTEQVSKINSGFLNQMLEVIYEDPSGVNFKLLDEELRSYSKETCSKVKEDIIPDNSKSVITAVIDNYGTTTEPYKGPSFIMPDGSYLDIKDVTNHSDVEYWLDQQGLSIKADYTRRSGSPTLRSLGCIRIDTPKYYVQLPYDNITPAQYSTLKDWIEFLFVECGAPFVEVMAQGTSPVRYRYEDDIDADYIVDRIRRYYITDHLYEAHEDLAEGPYLKEDAFGGATQVSNIGQHKRSSIDLMEEDEDSNDSLELKVSNN